MNEEVVCSCWSRGHKPRVSGREHRYYIFPLESGLYSSTSLLDRTLVVVVVVVVLDYMGWCCTIMLMSASFCCNYKKRNGSDSIVKLV